MDSTVVALSKTKILAVTFGALMLVAGGLWMLQLDAATIAAHRRFNSPIFVHTIGGAGAAFFSLCSLYGLRKFFDQKPGLVLNAHGIIDNASGVAAGLVPWSDIVGIEVYSIFGQDMLIVKVADPQKYVAMGSAAKRSLNAINTKMCGSPISIPSTSLQIEFKQLQATCQAYFDKYGKRGAQR